MLPVRALTERSRDVRRHAPAMSGMLPLRRQPCSSKATRLGSEPTTLQGKGGHVSMLYVGMEIVWDCQVFHVIELLEYAAAGLGPQAQAANLAPCRVAKGKNKYAEDM